MTYLVILDCENGKCKIFPVINHNVERVAAYNGYNLEEHHWMECTEIKIFN